MNENLKQQRLLEVKAAKESYKNEIKFNPAAHEAGRIDLASNLAKHAQLMRSNTKGEYVFVLSPTLESNNIDYNWSTRKLVTKVKAVA